MNKYTDNTIIEDSEKVKLYENMIGKYIKIKDKYFDIVVKDKKNPILMFSSKENQKIAINKS